MGFLKSRGFKLLVIVLISFLFFLLSQKDLDKDAINPDGINWHTRTQEFTKALYGGDYSNTFQAYHPGITLMWISGPLLDLFRNNHFEDLSTNDQKYQFLEEDYYAKLSLVVICTFIFFISALVLWGIAGFKFNAVFSIIFALEPFLIGMRRLYHLDYLMTALLFLSFLMLIFFNYKKDSILAPTFSGLFLALALLTKSTAVIFLPVVPFIFILGNSKPLKKLLGFLIFILSLAVFLYIFFPPVWKNPIKSAPKYFNKIAFGVTGIGMEGKKEIGSSGKIENITLDDTLEDKGKMFYLTSLFVRTTTAFWVLLTVSIGLYIYVFLKNLLLTIFRIFKNKKIEKLYLFSNEAWLAFWSLGFSIASIVGMSFAQKQSDRYEIIAYPFLIMVISYFLNFIKWYLTLPIMIAYTFFVLVEIKSVHPYYISYSNPYLGGVVVRMRALDGPPFGVAIYEAMERIKTDMLKNNYQGFYTISGPKSIKAISSGGKYSRFPSCVTDYVIAYALEDKPTYTCSRKYLLLDTVRIGNFDYWYIYKRDYQKHESNYE